MSGSTVGLEAHAWAVADMLRGKFKQSAYGAIILPFTVMRRLDCAFAPHRAAVLHARDNIPSDYDAELRERRLLRAAGDLRFYNTSSLTFTDLHNQEPKDLHDALVSWITEFSLDVRDILLNRFRIGEWASRLAEKDVLFQLVERVAAMDLRPRTAGDRGISNADMGELFENLIRRFSEIANDTAGEHFTPRDVVRLMADLLVVHDAEALTGQGVVRHIYDPTCGTGGMLTIAEERIKALNPRAVVRLFGQELNDASYAVCKSDMLLKGNDPSSISLGNTLTEDKHEDTRFHYMLANPPYGVDWKDYADPIVQESKRENGRFSVGLPRKTDGQLLFLLHMLSKMRSEGNGSRIGIVMNASPLFAGGAGQGENRIRRWILENDWLEAVIALPEQMFYNTGIATFIWLLSNRKPAERRGSVQLIDASGARFWSLLTKSLGKKRRELSVHAAADIVELFHRLGREGNLTAFSKILPLAALGYREVSVIIPRFDGSLGAQERLSQVLTGKGWTATFANDVIHAMTTMPTESFSNPTVMASAVKAANLDGTFHRAVLNVPDLKFNLADFADGQGGLKAVPFKLGARYLKDLLDAAFERDSEQVPMLESVQDYMEREVLPHAPGAMVDPMVKDEKDGGVGIVGYEIPFARHFYSYVPPRSMNDIDMELRELSGTLADMLGRTE